MKQLYISNTLTSFGKQICDSFVSRLFQRRQCLGWRLLHWTAGALLQPPGVNAPGSGHSLVHLARHQPSARLETSTLAENPSLEEIPSLELLACLLFYLYFIMLGPEQL